MKAAVLVALLALAAPTAAGAAEPETVQQKMVRLALAEAERNVRETPADSNLGPDIRRYHTAVKHARATEPWCAIFVSYIAKRAGYPLGSVGQGIWDIKNMFRWGRDLGWYFAKGTRRPKAGDIVVHGYGHAGIVIKVTRKGRVFTVDGNWSDTVVYHEEPFLSADGYIRLPSAPR